MSQPVINGLVKVSKGYAIKDFNNYESEPLIIGNFRFNTYEQAVNRLAHKVYPDSYKQYLLAVGEMGEEPTVDTWNNLMFIGHAYGIYDHEEQTFKNSRQLGMNASTDIELSYIEALDSTYNSLKSMVLPHDE